MNDEVTLGLDLSLGLFPAPKSFGPHSAIDLSARPDGVYK